MTGDRVVMAAACRGRWGVVVAGLGLVAGLAMADVARALPVETGRYRVSWNGISAAELEIGVGPSPTDSSAARIDVGLRTNRVVDFFWSFRATGWADLDRRGRPLGFRFDRHERGRPEQTIVEYDDDLLVGRYQRRDRYRIMEVDALDAVDPLAMIGQLRQALPAPDRPQSYHVFTGEARYRFVLSHAGTERVELPAGTFDAVRVDPYVWRLDRDEREGRIDSMTLWFAAASPHRLLRMRSKVFVGSVSCDLVELELPNPPPAAEPEPVAP